MDVNLFYGTTEMQTNIVLKINAFCYMIFHGSLATHYKERGVRTKKLIYQQQLILEYEY